MISLTLTAATDAHARNFTRNETLDSEQRDFDGPNSRAAHSVGPNDPALRATGAS